MMYIYAISSIRVIASAGILILFMAACFLRNSLWADRTELLLDTISKSPKKARVYTDLGLLALDNEDYSLAIDAFTRGLELNPYLKYAPANIGLAYEGLNMNDKAIEAYERAISINPRNPIPYYNLGLLYYKKMNDRKKGLDLFLKARDLDPLEPDVHKFLGEIYNDMGHHDQANEEARLFRILK